MSTSDPKPQLVYIARPPKPVSEMTDDERRRYARKIVEAFKQASGR